MRKKKSKTIPPRKHRLLYAREETAELMNCSVSTLRRWEDAGKLRAVKPGGPAGKTFYTAENIKRITGLEEVA